jgi:pimeloyl-ACP methyl ester carboxylesterase
VAETDLKLSDGRTLHVYETGANDADDRLTVFWHHGTPNVGVPPAPLFAAADELGMRWVSYDRPGYGGSTPHPDQELY